MVQAYPEEYSMELVTVSPKFQVVIPKRLRDQLGLKPGEKLRTVLWGGKIVLLRPRGIEEMEGAFPGLGPFEREEEDREP